MFIYSYLGLLFSYSLFSYSILLVLSCLLLLVFCLITVVLFIYCYLVYSYLVWLSLYLVSLLLSCCWRTLHTVCLLLFVVILVVYLLLSCLFTIILLWQTQEKSLCTLPQALTLNCQIESDKDVEFWQAQQRQDKSPQGSNLLGTGGNYSLSRWVPLSLKLKICQDGSLDVRQDQQDYRKSQDRDRSWELGGSQDYVKSQDCDKPQEYNKSQDSAKSQDCSGSLATGKTVTAQPAASELAGGNDSDASTPLAPGATLLLDQVKEGSEEKMEDEEGGANAAEVDVGRDSGDTSSENEGGGAGMENCETANDEDKADKKNKVETTKEVEGDVGNLLDEGQKKDEEQVETGEGCGGGEETSEEDVAEGVFVKGAGLEEVEYELAMVVCHVRESWMESQGNLVAHIKVGPSYHLRKEVSEN